MGRLGRQRDTTASCSPSFVLASSSPRRRDLLRRAGQSFEVEPSEIEEVRALGESPEAFARRVAREKALEVVRRRSGVWALGADTVVVLDREVLGKPADAAAAIQMLERLSGREHRVLTAFALVDPSGSVFEERSVCTAVTFRRFTPAEVERYVSTREPFGKAGAYAIQGAASGFVTALRGSYTNVVGLPIEEVREVLMRARLWRQS